MGIIVFLLMNSITGASAFLLTYKAFKFTDFIDSVLSLSVLYFALIVSTELLLGMLGVLYLRNVILINLGVLLVIWLITRNKRYYFVHTDIKNTLAQILNHKAALLLISLIFGFALVKFCINLVNPPFGWDDLNYHFTFPVEWLKNGKLNNPITIFDDPSPSYYPINGSLLFLWLILPLRNVFLADLGQVPFFILAVLAVYNISRKIGCSGKISFYACGLYFLIPNFFKQLKIAYLDVMVAALFLVCINFLFLLNRRFSNRDILVYSLSLGLLLGTKTLALPYCVLLSIPFFYFMLKNIKKPYLSLFFISLVIILGSFSYARNFLDTANPLYPLEVKLFGKAVFKGVMDSNIYRAHFKIEDYRISKLLFHEGLGVQTMIFILPAIFLALPVTLIKRRKNLDFNLIYFLILPFLIYLVYRYVIPLANTRYLYPLLGTGIIAGFYTAGVLSIPKSIINSLVVISALSSMGELAKRQELIVSIALAASAFFLLPYLARHLPEKRLIKSPLFIIPSVALMTFILISLEKDYIKNEYPRYLKMARYSGFWPDAAKAWDWLNSRTLGNNIAYAGRPVPFPLYGSSFKNNVFYVSFNKTEPAKLHYFPSSRYSWGYDFLSLHKNLEAKGNYRWGADYFTWLDNLKDRNTDYLFIYSLHQTKEVEFPLEDKWAKDNPVKFTPVFTNETVHIYRILK